MTTRVSFFSGWKNIKDRYPGARPSWPMNVSVALILVLFQIPYPRKSPSSSDIDEMELTMASMVDLDVALPVNNALPHSARSDALDTRPPPAKAAETIPWNGNAEMFVYAFGKVGCPVNWKMGL